MGNKSLYHTIPPALATYEVPKLSISDRLWYSMYMGAVTVLIALFAFASCLFIIVLTCIFVVGTEAITILIGNAILRFLDPTHFTSNYSAVAIGAMGVWPKLFLWMVLKNVLKPVVDETLWWWYKLGIGEIALSALSGALGSTTVCYYFNIDSTYSMDALHAAFAGVLGGTIMSLSSHWNARFQERAIQIFGARVMSVLDYLTALQDGVLPNPAHLGE